MQPLAQHRLADDAAGVAHEEDDGLGRHRIRRHDEIRLVLARLVIHHDDYAARADLAQDFFDAVHVVASARRSR